MEPSEAFSEYKESVISQIEEFRENIKAVLRGLVPVGSIVYFQRSSRQTVFSWGLAYDHSSNGNVHVRMGSNSKRRCHHVHVSTIVEVQPLEIPDEVIGELNDEASWSKERFEAWSRSKLKELGSNNAW